MIRIDLKILSVQPMGESPEPRSKVLMEFPRKMKMITEGHVFHCLINTLLKTYRKGVNLLDENDCIAIPFFVSDS